MPKKKVISMLEFLRTGMFGGIACGCTMNDVLRQFGKPDYIYQPDEILSFTYGSLEIWFHTEQKIVHRITLKRFHLYCWEKNLTRENTLKRHTHFFKQSKPKIPRKKFNSWVLRGGMDVFTFSRFLKTAKIEFRHSQWWRNKKSAPDQLNLDSGVRLFFDPPGDSHTPGLGFIEMRDDEIR
jgi:hypothetical protein